MILDLKKFSSCRCPVCSERSYGTITPFQINGGFSAKCPLCGASFLTVSKKRKGYLFKVSCFICDTHHEFTVSFDGVWKKNLLALGCPLTGIDLLYVGDKNEVYTASSESDALFSDFAETIADDDYLDNLPPLFEEAFKILNNRLISNRINCSCGHNEIALKLSQNGITVICDYCDAKLFIPISVPEDVQNLKYMQSIDLK